MTPSWGDERCLAGSRLDDAVVASRPAYRLRCGTSEYWVDKGSLLVLREIGLLAASRPGVGAIVYVDEIVELDLGTAPDPSWFSFDPPPGGTRMSWREYSDRFFGEPAGERTSSG